MAFPSMVKYLHRARTEATLDAVVELAVTAASVTKGTEAASRRAAELDARNA
jgi:hypothetical protein